MVRAVVQAGSVHTAVRVKAEATDPSSGQTISSQSEQLVVTTGLPDQNSFSLSATKLAINGNCDGASTTLNIRAADRYNNPVRSEEHTSELQSLMRISYAVFCLKKKKNKKK